MQAGGGSQCRCMAGWGQSKDADKQDCGRKKCDLDCGDHGSCDLDAGMCVCDNGFTGADCREPDCGPTNCNTATKQGTCAFVSAHSPAECRCSFGWTGADCGRHVFMAQRCANDCSGNGLCVDGKCVCGEGFRGADCSMRKCQAGSVSSSATGGAKLGPNCNLSACLNDCDGKGLCFQEEDFSALPIITFDEVTKMRSERQPSKGICSCYREYAGEDCSVPLKCLAPCMDACAYPNSEQCEFCKGQCLTASDGVVGKHSPFADLHSLMALNATRTGAVAKH
jgi:syndecan 4